MRNYLISQGIDPDSDIITLIESIHAIDSGPLDLKYQALTWLVNLIFGD